MVHLTTVEDGVRVSSNGVIFEGRRIQNTAQVLQLEKGDTTGVKTKVSVNPIKRVSVSYTVNSRM